MPRKPSQTLEQFNPALADQLVDQSLRSIAVRTRKSNGAVPLTLVTYGGPAL